MWVSRAPRASVPQQSRADHGQERDPFVDRPERRLRSRSRASRPGFERVALFTVVCTGLLSDGMPAALCRPTYRPKLTFTAVLPSPKRSSAALRRGESLSSTAHSSPHRSRAPARTAQRASAAPAHTLSVIESQTEIQRQPVDRPLILREEAEIRTDPIPFLGGHYELR